MERYCIDDNKWALIRVRLNEGRYHATACMLHDRYIYVFGGYRTKKLQGEHAVKIDRKNEVLINITSGRIERYDTNKSFLPLKNKKGGYAPSSETETDDDKTADSFDRMESWPTFELIHLEKDNINNVCQLICFPLTTEYLVGKASHGVFSQDVFTGN